MVNWEITTSVFSGTLRVCGVWGDVRTIGDKHLLDGVEGIHERVSVGEDGSLVKQVIPFEIGKNVGPGECGVCKGRRGHTRG